MVTINVDALGTIITDTVEGLASTGDFADNANMLADEATYTIISDHLIAGTQNQAVLREAVLDAVRELSI